MEYTVNKLAKLAGISTRTLRYYDEIGLLQPDRISTNGYRIYGQVQVDILQQILFYRELGISLDEIKEIIAAPGFNEAKALEGYLTALWQRKEQIEMLIQNVSKTISSLKGKIIMSDSEKFEGFKKKLIEDNEQKYGKEIREKYGDEAVRASNTKVAEMTAEQWRKQEELSLKIFESLKKAMQNGDPACEDAQKACDLHRQWLCLFWKDGTYSKQAHMGIGDMYVSDERFKAYYDNALGAGTAEFLQNALAEYTK